MLNSVDESTLVDITYCVTDDDSTERALRDMPDRKFEERTVLLDEELGGYGDNDIRSNNDKSSDNAKRRKFVTIGVAVVVTMTLIILLSTLVPGRNNTNPMSGAIESEFQKAIDTNANTNKSTATEIIDTTNFTTIVNETVILPNETLTENIEDIDPSIMFVIATASPTTDSNISDYEKETFASDWWQEEEAEQEMSEEKENHDRDQVHNMSGAIIVDMDTIDSGYKNTHVGGHPVPSTSSPTLDPTKKSTVVQQETGTIVVDIDTITSSYEAVTDEGGQTRDTSQPTSAKPSQSPTDRPTTPLKRNPTNNPTKKQKEKEEEEESINSGLSTFERPSTSGSGSDTRNKPNKEKPISSNEMFTNFRPEKSITQSPTIAPTKEATKKPTKKPTTKAPSDSTSTPTSTPTTPYVPSPVFQTFNPTTWLPTNTYRPTDFYPWEHGIYKLEAARVETPTVTPVPTTPYPTKRLWPTHSPTTWMPTTTYAPTVLYPWSNNNQQWKNNGNQQGNNGNQQNGNGGN